ncbi:Hypothetical protein NGAL_HAMBI1145_09700 [Neorhizobium galegae bv. officinalis]|uniref:Zinc finger DksA/TraR C4-type domain-containing protein n=1 Tax=Neorhizobium galegae bv. officinalis TaxID=323656 RepID=A0A0T7FB82_NEOGA|nr:TraR/DksA C4-type zinc finger protein [Neorhizobium galegae]CDZ32199.1 Hypothetical protein NGAL_HAMBI1145_09700 [Neorhizobium galegae bv. officinalis]
MNFSNAALDLASVREQQERDALIADAIAALEQPGKTECVDCGHAIPKARLTAAPFAVRCIECQKLHEQEKYHR